MKKFVLFLLLITMGGVSAQTGVNVFDIHPYAALQIDALNDGKGMMLPRLTTQEIDELDVTDIEDGLSVYNTDEDCVNYWSLGDRQWKSICGKEGEAHFKISACNTIEVHGQYMSETVVDKSHFITVIVQVEKPGEYQISASSVPHKGYYYYVSGEFPTTGIFTIRVPAVGKLGVYNRSQPIDTFTVSLNGTENKSVPTTDEPLEACTFDVKTMDSSVKPSYSWNCRSVKVHGVYKLHGELNPEEHYITVKITADPGAVGAMYSITTDEIDGIQFAGEGLIEAGEKEIVLRGKGKIYSSEVKNFAISSNSIRATGQCAARVRVVIPSKRLLTMGISKNNYGYNFSGTAASNKLINTKTNYGELATSVVPFAGWGQIIDGGNSISDANLRAYLLPTTGTPVDVVVLGYSYYVTPNQAEIYAAYLKNGGVILAFTESNAGATNLLRAATNNNSISVKNGPGAGAVYQFSAVDDPLLNGAFGDLRNKYWGEDASRTSLVSGIDQSSVYVYSTGLDVSGSSSSNASALSAFRLKDYSLLYVGDGGFNSNNGGSSKIICPFMLDSSNKPIEKTTYAKNVSNAIFTANAFAWAIEEAERNGSRGN